MYCILIIDAIGNVKQWQRGNWPTVQQWAKMLPANGWTLHSIVEV